jgi:succinate dehydrogenase / fumarate reductase cytochrome b subunit
MFGTYLGFSVINNYGYLLMSASAVRSEASSRSALLWNAANGKKAVMAVTGIVLTGFLAGHLAGNLGVYLGPHAFNQYAATIKSISVLLWGTRVALLLSVALHIWSAASLYSRNSSARPTAYVKKTSVVSTYASRTMYMSGPILALFIVYHLLHFTVGVGGTPFEEGKAYENLVAGFQVWYISLFYIVAMAMLCTHLFHGLWSMTQTLGFHHPKYTPRIRSAAKLIAILLFLGFASIPVSVLTGIIKPVESSI